MKNTIALLGLILAWTLAGTARAGTYPDRFVWVFGWGLRNDNDVSQITQLLEKSAQSGLNGAVLSASLDTLCQQSPEFFRRLDQVRQAAERHNLELIPSLFSVGYGGGALAHNRQLAEGLPVEDAIFVAGQGEARFVPEASAVIANGGFEEAEGNRFQRFNFHDQPGVISFVDTEVKHGGRAALRLENFRSDPQHGHARVMQEIQVRPRRCYRVSVWVKTEGLKPTGAFRLFPLVKDRDLASRTFALPSTSDWRKLTMIFNSLSFESVRLYGGLWGAKEGRVWLDDWTIEEVGPLNVLRRPGTPVTVRSDEGAAPFDEGRDFAPLEDSSFNFYRVDREWPVLRLLPGSRIQEGQRLRVSWYHPMVIHESQVTVCMAEPALYDIYEHEARLLAEHLHPRRILLNMDEIRMGGTCRACRGQDMAKLLGQCVTRQSQILRRFNPGAEIYIWSDMLDPNHNAHGDYYLVEGDYTGSWKHVPKDLIMAVWGGSPREKSLRFFAEQGFRTLVACYYDAEDLEDVKSWLALVKTTPNVQGFMYTPWQRKYGLVPEFGALIGGTF